MLKELIRDADYRAEAIERTCELYQLPRDIVEKDFWVCLTLSHLFHESSYRDSIIFKGGTSLSKAYGIIQRFSEDIDLIIDWRLLGYGLNEPWEERSNSKQDKFVKETVPRTNEFLSNDFVPTFREELSNGLGMEVDVRVGEDSQTVLFSYPRLYASSSPSLLDVIKLEIGPLAAWSPYETATIRPYVADVFQGNASQFDIDVRTAVPERTFWEKATILHQEANRPSSKAMPKRYSRHYYDMYMLGHSFVLDNALEDLNLLYDVIRFKEKFYRTPWAHLSEAVPGTLRLVPQSERREELEADYEAMAPMIYGERPSFSELVEYLSELEEQINYPPQNLSEDIGFDD